MPCQATTMKGDPIHEHPSTNTVFPRPNRRHARRTRSPDPQHHHRHGIPQTPRLGVLSDGDRQANDEALQSGARILSSYLLPDETKLWIITDATDENGTRAATTLLLPEEY